ncbi:hypothetical protein EVAR_39043_1 [Eumeta japonica]|uniref:Uncharacterized protein n=1 Tax=Eumeta variegata TaxID=151549 RepID=A0A4C1WRD9_EUMVA|nr:hypothetical protein EVAR_39043_1 [Eumeta japonica]
MWTREVRLGTLNVCEGIDHKIDDVCELTKKNKRLNILCSNETKTKDSGEHFLVICRPKVWATPCKNAELLSYNEKLLSYNE